MALGRRRSIQNELFVSTDQIAKAPAYPFYSCLEKVFKAHRFDTFCEELCQPYYAEVMGRQGLAPGVYFRLLMLGYFERIPSERQIAWRVADSLSLRHFTGRPLKVWSHFRYYASNKIFQKISATTAKILRETDCLSQPFCYSEPH